MRFIVTALIIVQAAAFLPHIKINGIDEYGSFLGYPSLINRGESYSRFLNTTSTTWA